MKKILIMGGNQFLGRAIVERFLENKKWKTFVLNRGSRRNLDKTFFLKADRTNYQEMEKGLTNLEFDVIVDVSARTEKDVDILHNVMKGRFKQYILISSASIYNKNELGFINSENSSVGENKIWGDYSKNKFLAEQKTIENANKNNFKYTIFRPFYIYGIGNNLDRENYFFSRIKHNIPIYVPNKADNLVQFGYVDDLSCAVEMSALNVDFFDEIFNISGDEYITIMAFIEICGKIMQKEPVIRFVDTKESKLNARDWFPFRDVDLFGDISKIESIGFRNQYSLIKGLEKTYKYNEENNLIKEPVLNAIEKSFGNYKI